MWTAKTLIRLGRYQADLSLRWAQRSFCWFWHEVAQLSFFSSSTLLKSLKILWSSGSHWGQLFVLHPQNKKTQQQQTAQILNNRTREILLKSCMQVRLYSLSHHIQLLIRTQSWRSVNYVLKVLNWDTSWENLLHRCKSACAATQS